MTRTIEIKIVFLVMALVVLLLTGCTTSMAKTCDRFGMDTEYVLVKSTDSETLGETKTITQFKCTPRKYKAR
jgi:outer membrane biogenesis lipoprotein LolB